MQKTIQISAPGKLMLFGEHAVVYDHPCIVTAVGQRLSLRMQLNDKSTLDLNAPEVGVEGYSKTISELGQNEIPKEVRFIEVATKNFITKYALESGITIQSDSQFSSKLGFGSSSASTVAVMKGLSELFEVHVTLKELFELAYKTVLDIQGKGSGFDLAAAIYGGTLYFVTGGKIIEPLEVSKMSLIVGYSGIKADTTTLVNKVADLAKQNPDLVNIIFDSIEKIVIEAKEALIKNDLQKVGSLMNQNQECLQKLGVSIPKLDSMIEAAVKAGAYGAKLSGAGGGDCMIAVGRAEKEVEIKRAITEAGGEVIDIETEVKGVSIES